MTRTPVTLTIRPIIAESAVPAIVELAEEVDDMGFEHPVGLEDALYIIFVDPAGPARLIKIDGVDGWTVDTRTEEE